MKEGNGQFRGAGGSRRFSSLKVGGPEGWGVRGWGPRKVEAQNLERWEGEGECPKCRAVLSLLLDNISICSSSLGVFSWNWWCFKRPGPEESTFGVLLAILSEPSGLVLTVRKKKNQPYLTISFSNNFLKKTFIFSQKYNYNFVFSEKTFLL